MSAQAWPGFTADDLARWAEGRGLPGERLERLERALRDPVRPAGFEQGQRPGFYVDGLRAAPWHDPAEYRWTHELVTNANVIREELFEIAGRRLAPHPETRRLAAAGVWDSVELYRMGVRREENCRACPRTMAIVDRIDGVDSAGLVYFSAMRPGTRIRPHCGPHNLRVRCHLGLHVRPGCGMRVGTTTRVWREGECLLFDDSFVHEVWNTGADTRAVLLLDVWHPDLTPIEIQAFTTLSTHHSTGERPAG
jgi:aspartate beta-hydroxylase